MYCQECGTQIASGGAYCAACGTAAGAGPRPPNVPVARAVAPSYGYLLDEGPGHVTITVPERRPPGGAERGCISVFGTVVLVFAGTLIGFIIALISGLRTGGFNFGAAPQETLVWYVPLGAVAGGGLAFLLAAVGSARKKGPYLKCTICIQRDNITLNGAVYARAHVRSWTIRWTEGGGGSFLAEGSSLEVGLVALVSSEAQKLAKQSHRITFDYGEHQIVAVGGLTEAGAYRVMDAIRTALSRNLG